MHSNPFTDTELLRRVAAARTEMARRGLDMALFSSPENIFYLIGLDHWGYFAPHLLIVPAEGDLILITRQMEQVVIRNIRELADGDFIADDLPLMSSVKLEWIDEDTHRARTQSLVPVTYHLERISGGRDAWRHDHDSDDDDDLDARPPSDDEDEYVSPW